MKILYQNTVPDNFTGVIMTISGAIFWYKDGEEHRIGAPACEGIFGHLGWSLDGMVYSEKEYFKKLKNL